MSETAQATQPGNQIDSLVAYLQSSEPALDDKNRAIWLLGELRDPRALPALEALDRGEPCNHAPFVCQYELRKAVDKIQGITFRHLFPALTGGALPPHGADHPY